MGGGVVDIGFTVIDTLALASKNKHLIELVNAQIMKLKINTLSLRE